MDPYLEGELWTTVHSQLAAEIARQLTPKIAPKYTARTEKRFVLAPLWDEDSELAIYADVGVRHARKKAKTSAGGTVGVLEAPLVLPTVIEEKVPHFWVEIRDTRNRKLVTAIEILSPTNKRGLGRQEYLEKRSALLRSPVHLIEIDLLRKGLRPPMRKKLPRADYFVFLSRARRRPHTEIWPILLNEHLPVVPVPLMKVDPDVPLDLQDTLTQVYDGLRYDLDIDYDGSPDVPLSASAAAWAEKLIRAARKH
ncbi:MAG: DUF4058 family protein [Gemmataceae bacterium]|nr:DUF4058 family protein [Gemmataceae bacterium]